MKISGFLKESVIDYPGKVSSVIFTSGCNYKCPSCHSKHIINGKNEVSEEEIFSYLDSRKGWIEGVVVCGGEPTLQPDLIPFTRKFKEKDLAVKLDTNGSNPGILQHLLKERLVDYVALDVKGPRELYSSLTSTNQDSCLKVEDNMRILSNSGVDYELRTTIVPVLRMNRVNWLTPKELGDMARWIVEVTGKNQHKHYLQKFVARDGGEMVDKMFSKNNLPKELHETPNTVMQGIYEAVSKYLPNCKIR